MTDINKSVGEIQSAFQVAGFPKSFLDKYDQLECLASHHFCETFLVSRKSSGQLCVAKCYSRSDFGIVPSETLLAELHHPNLPAYIDRFENDRMICIVREYIPGVPLSEYAKEKELSQEEIVSICLKLADILIYLHNQNPPVIHRDIKPENLIITRDDQVVLIDFDIARHVRQDGETDTMFFGTKGYAPPEQYGFTQTDCRADIYSFGVLLRFLLTDSVRENQKIRVYRPLQKIIRRCTAFAPEMRYPDMKAVRSVLLRANPRSQTILMVKWCLCLWLSLLLIGFAGFRLYRYMTRTPFTDGTIIPVVIQDKERQAEAVTYLREKYGTHLFDETGDYFTVGLLKNVLIEVYGMDETYVRTSSPDDPPIENPNHFLPWSLNDAQYVDRDDIAYFVTKVYWPKVVADWSSLKKDTGQYPGCVVALKWCEKYNILLGVNRPDDISIGEAAIAFANADRVFEAIQGI